MTNLILVEPMEAGIVSVALNRPECRNALSIALLDQLCAEIELLERQRDNRVLLLRGAGKVFSAGLDLREAADGSLIELSAGAVRRALERVRGTSLIVIAAVQGGAFAGGAGLMAACDIAIACSDAKFAFPEARRGLVPALVCDVLRQKVREGDLRELFLTGETIDANRALQMGLIQRLTAAQYLLAEAIGVARSVLASGPDAIRQTKALLNEAGGAENHDSRADPIERHLAARHSAEAREGMAAFIEKREPKWT